MHKVGHTTSDRNLQVSSDKVGADSLVVTAAGVFKYLDTAPSHRRYEKSKGLQIYN
jgi:hypothetical protein